MITLLNSNARNRNIIPLVCNSHGLLLACDKGYYKYLQNPQYTILFPKLFLGRQSEAVCSGYDYDVIESVSTDSNGIAQFSMLHNDGTRTNVSVLQAIHIIMSEVVSLIESVYPTASHPHQHYVIGIPSYWNAEQVKHFRLAIAKTAVKDATFVYDVEAFSLNYGFYINSERGFRWKERRVMIVDIGYEHITVFCTHYSNNSFKILHTATSLSYGGRLIDQILTELVESIMLKEGITRKFIDSNPKLKAEIRTLVEQSKIVFSNEIGDSMQFPLSISDTDISVTITHQEFVQQCQKHKFLQTIRHMCITCLDEVDGVDEVILEGSCSRLCVVSNVIKTVLEKNKYSLQGVLKNTSNHEEDFCRGCCLSCICRAFPVNAKDPTISLPSEHIILKTVPLLSQESLESTHVPDTELLSSTAEWEVEERNFNNLRSLKNEIYNMILTCQNMLSEGAFPYWYRKDMLEYTKLLMLQLSISNSYRDNTFDYQVLKDTVDRLQKDIERTQNTVHPVGIP